MKKREYIQIIRSMGASDWYILTRHIIKELLPWLKVVLEVRNLSIRYHDAEEPVVRDLSFQIHQGEILLDGRSIKYGMGTPATGERIFTWRDVALVPQSSMSCFNPIFTIRQTMMETMRACRFEGKK